MLGQYFILKLPFFPSFLNFFTVNLLFATNLGFYDCLLIIRIIIYSNCSKFADFKI